MTTKRPAHLIAARQAQARDARTRAEQALRTLIRDRAPITFSAVADRAGVSRRYLYSHPDLADSIRATRANTPTLSTAPPAGAADPIINALRDQLRRQADAHQAEMTHLRQEIHRLRAENARLLGQVISSTHLSAHGVIG